MVAKRIITVAAALLLSCALWARFQGNARPTEPAQIHVTPGADLQAAIDAARAGTTIVFAPGAYTLASALTLKSGIDFQCRTGAVITGQRGIFSGHGVRNITISGCVFDGGASGGPGIVQGAIYLTNSGGAYSRNIRINGNRFQNWQNSAVFWLWDVGTLTVQSNTVSAAYQVVSWHANDDSVAPGPNVIADNIISGVSRMAIEVERNVAGLHVDRNTISDADGVFTQIGISVVGYSSTKVDTGGTILGNKVTGTPGQNRSAIEVADSGFSIEQNAIDGYDWGFSLSSGPDSGIENNTFTNVPNGPFGEDGGYTNNWWIGNNSYSGTIYGGASGTVSGWVGPGAGQHGPYGTQPPVNHPSAPP